MSSPKVLMRIAKFLDLSLWVCPPKEHLTTAPSQVILFSMGILPRQWRVEGKHSHEVILFYCTTCVRHYVHIPKFCMYAHINTCVRILIHLYICIEMFIHVCMHMYIYMHICIYIYIHTYIYMQILTSSDKNIYIYMHIYIYIYTYIYMQILKSSDKNMFGRFKNIEIQVICRTSLTCQCHWIKQPQPHL